MSLGGWFGEQDSAVQALVVVGVGFGVLFGTVVGAAVLGTFVLGLGGDVGSGIPTASFSF